MGEEQYQLFLCTAGGQSSEEVRWRPGQNFEKNMKKKHFFFSPCQVLLPLLTGQPLSPEKLEGVTEELNVVLKQFEEKFLQDKPFIVGNEISLADLVALVELMQVRISCSAVGYASWVVGRPGCSTTSFVPDLSPHSLLFSGVKTCSVLTLTRTEFAREHLL